MSGPAASARLASPRVVRSVLLDGGGRTLDRWLENDVLVTTNASADDL